MSIKRTVFFISDRTAITAETFGHSLLHSVRRRGVPEDHAPFIDTMWKAQDALEHINDAKEQTGRRPIIFSTIVNSQIRKMILSSEAAAVDLFETFIGPWKMNSGFNPPSAAVPTTPRRGMSSTSGSTP